MFDTAKFDKEMAAVCNHFGVEGFKDDPDFKVMEDLKQSLITQRPAIPFSVYNEIVTSIEIDVSRRFVESEIYKECIYDIALAIHRIYKYLEDMGIDDKKAWVRVVKSKVRIVYHK